MSAKPQWDLSEAVRYVQSITPMFRERGFCLAIGGSVLEKGQGEDLDLVVYPIREDCDATAIKRMLGPSDWTHKAKASIFKLKVFGEGGLKPVDFIFQTRGVTNL